MTPGGNLPGFTAGGNGYQGRGGFQVVDHPTSSRPSGWLTPGAARLKFIKSPNPYPQSSAFLRDLCGGAFLSPSERSTVH